MPIIPIPALGRLRQINLQFQPGLYQACLGFIVRTRLKEPLPPPIKTRKDDYGIFEFDK
jgi:hypothetical protein